MDVSAVEQGAIRATPRYGQDEGKVPQQNLSIDFETEFNRGFNTAIRTSIAVMRRFNGPNSEGIKILRSLYNEQLERY